jgi:hypothetical protein
MAAVRAAVLVVAQWLMIKSDLSSVAEPVGKMWARESQLHELGRRKEGCYQH